jgi:protein-ribulosamine 3-kinase
MNADRLDPVRFDTGSLARVIAHIRGEGVTVRSEERVHGGSINDSCILTLSDRSRFFLKRNTLTHAGLFDEEARGLLALSLAEGPGVPKVYALFADGTTQHLLLEYIESGRSGSSFFGRFGRALARLHRTNRCDRCGFERDNHIGSTEQRNGWSADWHRFFGEQRLVYQAELALQRGLGDQDMVRRTRSLVKHLPDLIPHVDEERASLLHGDLWGGNYMVDTGGDPVLIDPAVYYGHREADLAMTELFGGFSPEFYRAYQQEWPLEPGYLERRDIYNLYHLLNHLNLFGGGYLGSCRAILRRYT